MEEAQVDGDKAPRNGQSRPQRGERSVPLSRAARGEEQHSDLICLSHLRWDFVFQRPQHLMVRWGRTHRVFFIEEPVWDQGPARLSLVRREGNVTVVVPHLPEGLDEDGAIAAQRHLLDSLLSEQRIQRYVLWYYTPMALPFTRHLCPQVTLYDCMDELSAFAGASPALRAREAELFSSADVVLTGGFSLYEAKCRLHPNVYAMPSSVDVAHFSRARRVQEEPADQAKVPHPRLGFFGVIDERMDIELLRGVAEARPDWQLILVGPVVKIDPSMLPRRDNIHYLGKKTYEELPAYLAGWDVALLPFARNESTRFISPTKTPEYLAAGKPVVSTSIRDVVRPYGQRGLVLIADTVSEFVAAVEACLSQDTSRRLDEVDRLLSQMSWDRTFSRIKEAVDRAAEARRAKSLSGRTEAGAGGGSCLTI